MSALLTEILADLKPREFDYEEFLKRIVEVAKQVQGGKATDTQKSSIHLVNGRSITTSGTTKSSPFE